VFNRFYILADSIRYEPLHIGNTKHALF